MPPTSSDHSGRKTRATVEALGLGRIDSSREHTDSPSLRGMLAKVRHLVEVEED